MPQCFQKPTFKIADAIKIIDYKYKMKLQQMENKKDFHEDNREPKGALEDDDDEIKIIKKVNLKNSLNYIIYMNDWESILLMYGEDLDTDDEILLFSESDSDDEKNLS